MHIDQLNYLWAVE